MFFNEFHFEIIYRSTYLFLLVWHAPLGVRSAKCRHQSPEWTILSHSYRLIRERLLDLRSCWIVFIHVVRGHPGGLQFSEGEAVTPGICLVWFNLWVYSKIFESLFILSVGDCGLSPPKCRVVRWRNFAHRLVRNMCRTYWVLCLYYRGRCYENNDIFPNMHASMSTFAALTSGRSMVL